MNKFNDEFEELKNKNQEIKLDEDFKANLKIKLDELKRLCDLNYVSKADQERMKKLISEFDGMPNLGSSMLLAEYHQLLLSKSLRLKELGVL